MDIAAIIVFAALALAICIRADDLGQRLKLIDAPDGNRKLHGRATPMVGGLAVALPVSGAAFWLAATTDFVPLFTTLGAITLAFMVIGLADDRHHLPPVWRLVLSLGICVGAMTAVPGLRVDFLRFSFIYRVFLLDSWSTFFTLVSLIGLVNALNMADGKNGLLTGLALCWTMMIAIEAPGHLALIFAVLGLALGIVFAFNVSGKVFLGDSGSYALGALFGFLAIHVHDARADWLPSDRVAMWFLIPVVDCLRLMGRRILLGKSPFTPDRNHLHHILEGAVRWRFGLPLYLALVIAPTVAAQVFPDLTLLWAMLALGVYVALVTLLGRHGARASKPVGS